LFRQDQWLSSVLGMPCFGAGGLPDNLSSAAVQSGMAAAAPQGRAFFAVKRAADEIETVETLIRAGFNVVDVNVTLAHNGEATASRDVEDVVVGKVEPQDQEGVADLAGRCFIYSRFHADRLLGASRADAIKREWARNACRGRAATVYVARRAGEVAGFLAVMKRESESKREAIIDLIGVDARHQGKGIGRSLSERFINEWRGQADKLVVGTQAANIPALRLYESLGFRVSETGYALHAHLRDGKVMA
jgi:ribosomal protein S18 acetylase RimI-like enzyme